MADLQRDKTLALAAIFQAAALTDQLAWRGHADSLALEALLKGVLVFDTDNPTAIFGGPAGLQVGLRALELAFATFKQTPRQQEIVRYALGLTHLERQLEASSELQSLLRRRLEQAGEQLKHFEGLTAPAMLNNLGHIYVDSIGTLGFRIQVKGNASQLQADGMPEQIRATLLAGVRAAWLWHRLGGRRWHLIFTRAKILREIRKIIKELNQQQL
jgi:high frequency lysogenization protein